MAQPKRGRKQALKEVFFGPKDPMAHIRQADVVLQDYGFKPVFETKNYTAKERLKAYYLANMKFMRKRDIPKVAKIVMKDMFRKKS